MNRFVGLKMLKFVTTDLPVDCTSFGGWTKPNVDWEGAAGLDWIEACELHAASKSASGHLICVENSYT